MPRYPDHPSVITVDPGAMLSVMNVCSVRADPSGMTRIRHRPKPLGDLTSTATATSAFLPLGRGELPADLKPHRQRRPTSVEQRARRHRRLSLASGALEAIVRDPPTPNISTSWADEPVRPAQPLQIVQAVRVRGEP